MASGFLNIHLFQTYPAIENFSKFKHLSSLPFQLIFLQHRQKLTFSETFCSSSIEQQQSCLCLQNMVQCSYHSSYIGLRLGERFTSPVLLHIHKTLWEIKFTRLGKLGSKFSLLSSPLQTLGKLFRTFGLLLFQGPETLFFY